MNEEVRPLPAREARLAAGLTLQVAAKKLRLTAKYLAACERGEFGFGLPLAESCARLYGARLEDFRRPHRGGEAPRPRRRERCLSSAARRGTARRSRGEGG